eukprot:GFYU01009835.1.p2 GENE.GFYU01009835.1~~GFYU01009835.1.p2  ORF type:complete len:137 (+),score=36.53 GFYU01009835.1:166-576(+)
MAGKKKGGGGGKKKEKKAELDASPLALEPWQVGPGEILRTPLGVEAKVLGVHVESGALWVMYPKEYRAPIHPKSRDELALHGFHRIGEEALLCRHLDTRLYTARGLLPDPNAPADGKKGKKGKKGGKKKGGKKKKK